MSKTCNAQCQEMRGPIPSINECVSRGGNHDNNISKPQTIDIKLTEGSQLE